MTETAEEIWTIWEIGNRKWEVTAQRGEEGRMAVYLPNIFAPRVGGEPIREAYTLAEAEGIFRATARRLGLTGPLRAHVADGEWLELGTL